MLKIACWNVNSIRSRILSVEKFIKEADPDVLLLQELKCEEQNFPYELFEDMGYNIKVVGQKTYNGVAICSKYIIEDVISSLPTLDSADKEEARFIEGTITANGEVFRLASVYVPNGSEVGSDKFAYKMRFFDALAEYFRQVQDDELFVAGGDYNVAIEEIDIHNPEYKSVGFHPDERAKMRTLVNAGINDVYRMKYPGEQQFSWWDYRAGSWQNNKGMRIDYLMVSNACVDVVQDAGVYMYVRGWPKPSDHAPIWITCR